MGGIVLWEFREALDGGKVNLAHLTPGRYLIQVKTEREMHTSSLAVLPGN